MKPEVCDFIVVGSGLSGTTASCLLAKFADVLQVSKTPPTGSNSWAAQGGVAAALKDSDSPQLHAADTLAAGAGLCDVQRVQRLTQRAPQLMAWLTAIGAGFDSDEQGRVRLGLEGAHSQPRIWHAGGDATGRHILQAVDAAAAAEPRLARWTDMEVTGLLLAGQRVVGIFGKRGNQPSVVYARRAVILATGGIGQLYPYTSNPTGATGSGIALAYLAGARVQNMEFVQFHPTVLAAPGNPRFLISEAVRGAGAKLFDEQGRHLMADFPRQDLEPRDLVARQIHRHLLAGGRVYLDARGIPDFAERFPTISARLATLGIHPEQDLIPVAPAAHFFMGGVAADLSGRTSLDGLFVLGEAACTGVHGANRLASNSLLECLLMGHEVAAFWQAEGNRANPRTHKTHTDASNVPDADRVVEIQPDDESTLQSIHETLWQAGGIVRDPDRMRAGLDELASLATKDKPSPGAIVASLILQAALMREESRGAHFRTDVPQPVPAWDDQIIVWLRQDGVDVGSVVSLAAVGRPDQFAVHTG
ncbi:MAG: L-aspartate oxidase [Alicyclobacillus herbarius]|uniref:L-aspartate oxidase n=1 Tax=Alicyclobacillus herbarius TaxID=122960 RepID=UPI00235350BA|nr:L-aspartate oxidase [Alicyclobacillus herbarius]MCL6631963.1 L-aspartate oxidase [Alicyclobacillus herbarius]